MLTLNARTQTRWNARTNSTSAMLATCNLILGTVTTVLCVFVCVCVCVCVRAFVCASMVCIRIVCIMYEFHLLWPVHMLVYALYIRDTLSFSLVNHTYCTHRSHSHTCVISPISLLCFILRLFYERDMLLFLKQRRKYIT